MHGAQFKHFLNTASDTSLPGQSRAEDKLATIIKHLEEHLKKTKQEKQQLSLRLKGNRGEQKVLTS